MTAVQQLDNIDIVRLRDVAGLPTWVRDLTLIAFKSDDTGDATRRAAGPSIFVVEDVQDARSPLLGGHDSRIQFVPDRHDKNDPFIRGLLLAADKIRSIE